jgi:hypothetical protein
MVIIRDKDIETMEYTIKPLLFLISKGKTLFIMSGDNTRAI